jgi:RNA polymerase sigma-70 factor (ECF subfamily)
MDRELAIRARSGDHEAFAELAARSIGRLTAVARLILRDEDRAQDAVQDALVDAWRDIRGLRDPDRLEAWLHRLLVHSCYSHARRDRRRTVVEVSLTPADEPKVADVQRSVAAQDQLERGLRRLSHEQRVVLVLTYYVDLPLADAARVLDIPVGTMKSRLSRATQALRAALDADDREPALAQERFA